MSISSTARRMDSGALDGAVCLLDFERGYGRIKGRPVSLSTILQCARASAGYGQDARGGLVSYGAAVPRYVRRDGLSGLLVEPAATNVLLHSRDLTQAAWSKTGSPTTSRTAAGVDGQILGCVLTDNAAAATAKNRWTQVVALPSDAIAWTVSGYLRKRVGPRVNVFFGITTGVPVIGGDVIFDLDLGRVVAKGAGLLAARLTPAPGGYWRFQISLQNTLGAGACVVEISRPTDADAPITVDADMFQLERGYGASSPIVTTSSQVTRATDGYSVAVDGWFNASRGALFVEATLDGDRDATQYLAALATASNDAWIAITRAPSGAAADLTGNIVVGGTFQYSGSAAGAYQLPRRIRALVDHNSTGGTFYAHGAAADYSLAPYATTPPALASIGTGLTPSTLSVLRLGGLGASTQLGGVLHRVGYIPGYVSPEDASRIVAGA